MNKIVREHYPVSQLPDDLRKDFSGLETVTVIGELGNASAVDHDPSQRYHNYEKMMAGIKGMTLAELMADRKAHPENYRGNVTPEEAVARIRALRDEWDSDR